MQTKGPGKPPKLNPKMVAPFDDEVAAKRNQKAVRAAVEKNTVKPLSQTPEGPEKTARIKAAKERAAKRAARSPEQKAKDRAKRKNTLRRVRNNRHAVAKYNIKMKGAGLEGRLTKPVGKKPVKAKSKVSAVSSKRSTKASNIASEKKPGTQTRGKAANASKSKVSASLAAKAGKAVKTVAKRAGAAGLALSVGEAAYKHASKTRAAAVKKRGKRAAPSNKNPRTNRSRGSTKVARKR